MLLRNGESLVRSAYAVLEGEEIPDPARGPGVLYLTSRRLIFEAGEPRGIARGKPSHTVIDVSLHDVRDLSIERRRLGRARLEIELALGRPQFELLEPEVWAGAIAEAKRALPVGAPVATRTIIERQVVKVRCRFCGNLANEVDGRCASCGAPL
jgi:hypothetical protein